MAGMLSSMRAIRAHWYRVATTLTIIALLPVARPAQPALADEDPVARAVVRVMSIYVEENGDLVGDGELTYRLTVQQTYPGCGTNPNDPHPICHGDKIDTDFSFSSGDEETHTYNPPQTAPYLR